ncbi:MAG: type II secretion system F family protein [Planctomycetaceae bacterium]|nr:type II secretion system F family protein [Planctomycetaceae bacterium]
MPEYRYTARNESGEKIEGKIDAANEAEAAATLSASGLFPLALVPELQQAVSGKIRKVGAQKMAAFYSQLADLLHGGVPLLRAIKILQDQTSNQNLKFVLDQVYHRIEEGETLAEVMGRFPIVFGDMGIQMVRAGSEGGFLEESLIHVAKYTEAQDDLKGRITGAMAYPVVLTTFLTLVIVAILTFLVPKFEPVFDGLRAKGELPMITEWLLFVGNWMQTFILIAIPVVIALIVWYRVWVKTDKGGRTVDRIKIRTPLLGPIFEGFAVARFCRVLGTLLKNGVPILKALEIAADATGNKVIADAIVQASENISSGSRLAAPLAASNCFPRAVVEMIAVAEESNTLDTVLLDVATSLENRNWRTLDLAVRFLEPGMLIVLGGVILVLVVALMLPIMNMSQAF